MATDVTPARKNVYIEESDFQSPLSEAYGQKVAGSINFLNNYQNKAFDYKFLGNFNPIDILPTVYEDGTRGNLFNYEIVGVTGYLRDRGDSGTTEIEIGYIRAGVSQGSLRSTNLQITADSGQSTYFATDLLTPNSETGPGVTLPVFSTINLNAFDHLYVKLIGAATEVSDLTINIHYRPR